MPTAYRFDPVFPAHAIESCNATVIFDQAVPAKILTNLQTAHRTRLASNGLQEGPQPVGFQFDVATGKVVPLSGAGPTVYVTQDGGTKVTVVANQVSLQSTRYIRWANFSNALTIFLLPLIVDFCAAVSIAAVQLDYWDRFLWNGSWDNFDTSQLLDQSSGFIAPKAAIAPHQWHSHAGWFDYPAPGRRRLMNINVDVASATLSDTMATRPSVGIYTSINDTAVVVPPNANPSWISDSDLLTMLDQQHADLKNVLSQIILPAMASRIGL